MSKSIKYFCRSCKHLKSSKLTPVPGNVNGKSELLEVLRDFPQKIKRPDGTIEEKIFKTRQLECGHYTSIYTPGFTDLSSENLSEQETASIRREIDRSIIGKNTKELEEVILFQVDQYQTLLKYHSKGKLSAKYAIQQLDQVRERYSSTLSNQDEKIKFETKFAHFLDLKPTSNKVIERELSETEKAANKQRAALEAARALVRKSGHNWNDLFGSSESK